MNGRTLADEVRKRRPDIKDPYTTGYTPNAAVHHGVELIGKPGPAGRKGSRGFRALKLSGVNANMRYINNYPGCTAS